MARDRGGGRVLQVTPVFHPSIGGIENVVMALATETARYGWRSDVAEVRPGSPTSAAEMVDGVTVFRLVLYGNRIVGAAPALGRLIEDYDVVHVHDPQVSALSANAWLQSAGKPLVLSTHGGFFHTRRLGLMKQVHAATTARLLLARYAAILASSESDAEHFARLTDQVELAQNGVNTAFFGQIRRQAEPNGLKWIYWGRLSINKRLDSVLNYAAHARRRGFPVELSICGADADGLLEPLKRLAGRLGLSEAVRFHPALSDADLAKAVAAHSVFVTGSEYEGFGLSVIEAMAAGLAVVSRDIDPVNRFVRPPDAGVLLAFDGAEADLRSLEAFLHRPASEFEAMAQHNRAAAERHSWTTAVQRFVSVYERVRGGPAASV